MRLIPVFLFGILLFSCGNKNKVPNNVLPPKKMEAVLWDMLRAGEFINGFVIAKDTGANRLSQTTAIYDAVYRIHAINQKQFNESFAWYQQHPAMMKTIMDSLAAKTRTPESEPKKIVDSLKLEAPSDTVKLPPVDSTLPKIASDSVLQKQKARVFKKNKLKPVPAP